MNQKCLNDCKYLDKALTLYNDAISGGMTRKEKKQADRKYWRLLYLKNNNQPNKQ